MARMIQLIMRTSSVEGIKRTVSQGDERRKREWRCPFLPGEGFATDRRKIFLETLRSYW